MFSRILRLQIYNFFFHKFLFAFFFIVSFIPFFVFGHFWRQSYKNTKILHNLCLHFARQDGQYWKNGKKIMQLKWPKYPKPKDENVGLTRKQKSLNITKSLWIQSAYLILKLVIETKKIWLKLSTVKEKWC